MTQQQAEIRKKRRILRDEYGGMMGVTELARELGVHHSMAKQWGIENGCAIRIGKRIKYDVDVVAELLVQRRGFV